MTNLNRRELLLGGAFGLGALGLSTSRIAALNAAASIANKAVPNPQRQLLVVFLRGANDAANTVIPEGDDSYLGTPTTPSVRPNIKITNGLPLYDPQNGTSSFAKAHPNLAAAVSGGSSPDELGRIAWVHQSGNPTGARSHFTEQQIWETAKVPAPGQQLETEGFVPRLVQQLYPANMPLIPALGLASYFRMFHAIPPSPIVGEFQNINNPDLVSGSSADVLVQDQLSDELTVSTASDLESTVESYGATALDSAAALDQITVDASSFFPPPPAPAVDSPLISGVLGQFKNAVEALHDIPSCNVVGVNFGGFDTHTDQIPRHEELMDGLGRALRGVHDFSIDSARRTGFDENLITLVVSEFGRTAKDNGGGPQTSGTDHGKAGLCIVMGEAVNGGVINCDAATWANGLLATQGNLPSSDPDANALPVRTDFRTLYAEVLDKWFQLPSGAIDSILPNGAPNPADYVGVL